MNHIKTITTALLVAALPFAPTAFAADREHGDRRHGRPHHAPGHHNGHVQYGYGGHHYGHHYGHDYHHDTSHYSHNDHQAQIVLPFPPLPPFPFIVLNKKHHGGHIEIRRPF